MKAVLQTIRILVIIQITKNARCQDGFSNEDLLRLQQMASNDGHVEAITSYSTNIVQRDPNTQSFSSVSVRYQMADPDKNEDYNHRADRTRSRKVYRIKNPFQRPEEDEARQQDTETQDSGTGASNQYAAVQYSLPPDEFLQQMRERENQYYQQQQLSTQASSLSYTATPQPQYQYSTAAPSGYETNNQQQNQIPQLESKMSQVPTYLTNSNSYQYNPSNTYSFDGTQSTPSPISSYLSTSLPSSQFVGTQSYVSSSSPIYLSSPPNLQQYVSSPLSTHQGGSSEYDNSRATSTVGSNSLGYESDFSKKMQIDHYDNSANGIRYPINVQQYQHEYPSSTPTPSSSPYSDSVRESWQNSFQKSIQDLPQYQNTYNNNPGTNPGNSNSETHRIGNVPSANNVFLNLIQPDYAMNNLKSRTRDTEQETGQYGYYSHGDYGWKMPTKKPLTSQETYSPGNYQRYQTIGLQSSEPAAISQMNFHMDIGKPHGYEQISKSSPETIDPQEFAKAAAKAHEKQQQQQQQQQQQEQQQQQQLQQQHQQQLQQQQQQQQYYSNSYSSNYGGNILFGNVPSGQTIYGTNDKNRNRYVDNSDSNSYSYNNQQTDIVSVSPYFYSNSKENNLESKPKTSFDHDKALKNIVPIDVSNVVSNSETQSKAIQGIDNNNKYSLSNYGKEQPDLKQYYRSVTDSYYKDKNAIYGFNIKSKPDEYNNGNENVKQSDNLSQYYTKQQQPQDSLYSLGMNDNKRYIEGTPQSANYVTQGTNNYQDNVQSPANIHQQGHRSQNQVSDIASILKLNDIPYRLTQGLSSDSLRLNNFDQISIPTPLPIRINQNVGSHQLDVANNLLNKLLNKQQNLNLNRPDIDGQTGGGLSTVNGFKVANPFNVDLKLVADMLKGKPTVDDSHLLSFRDSLNKPPLPLKIDMSNLQQLLLKNENLGYGGLGEGLGALTSPYFEIYNSGRFPYQGVKYSRSQEEEESIVPIADASNNHPIGAVIEEVDMANVREASTGTDLTAQDEDSESNTFVEERPKNSYHSRVRDRLRHPNALLPDRHTFQRKHPKSDVDEPYRLLKPPPPRALRNRGPRSKFEKHGRRRRVLNPKVIRVLKTEPLYEAGSEIDGEEPTLQTVLRPPSPIAEAKSDVNTDHLDSS